MKTIFNHVTVILLSVLVSSPGFSQGNTADYLKLYNEGNYTSSYETIRKKLADIYSQRVVDKRVPTGFITFRQSGDAVDLMRLFRERRERGFFIEDNREISELHLYAGRCLVQLKRPREALNDYVQCLRFRTLEYRRDDRIYYEISRIFMNDKQFTAYADALETASTLNPSNYSYSLELGRALSTTVQKKKSIHHLERYVNSTDEKINPEIYLILAGLHEDTGSFLMTEKYYIRYLEVKPENGYIHFALGYTACHRTGNFALAGSSFQKATELLPKKELFMKSKSYEYMADMAMRSLAYKKAIDQYGRTLAYQDAIIGDIEKLKKEIKEIDDKINTLKASLLKVENFDEFEQFSYFKEKKARYELRLIKKQHQYRKLNPGRIQWNMAESYMRLDDPEKALSYYRNAIAFDYNANMARDMIVKIQLKIKRGY